MWLIKINITGGISKSPVDYYSELTGKTAIVSSTPSGCHNIISTQVHRETRSRLILVIK